MKWQKEKQDTKYFILATKVNATDIFGRKACKKKDLSQITYYNYDKTGHYSTKYLEFPKNSLKN